MGQNFTIEPDGTIKRSYEIKEKPRQGNKSGGFLKFFLLLLVIIAVAGGTYLVMQNMQNTTTEPSGEVHVDTSADYCKVSDGEAVKVENEYDEDYDYVRPPAEGFWDEANEYNEDYDYVRPPVEEFWDEAYEITDTL